MIKIISHRGNVDGPDPDTENSPKKIDLAINKGYLVEVDLRILNNNEYWLGHDVAQYKISVSWLLKRKNKLIIHAKDLQTANKLISKSYNFNWFYHTDEDIVLTSKGWIWAYPNIYLSNAITVLLGKNLHFPKNIFGVCTDYPILIEKLN